MDKGLTKAKMGFDSLAEKTQNALEFVCPSLKVVGFIFDYGSTCFFNKIVLTKFINVCRMG